MKLAENHPFYTVTSTVDAICAPLKEHHLTHFVYLRSYLDGSRFYLSNMINPLKAYLEEEHYRFGYCESQPDSYADEAVLWSTVPHQHIFQFRRTHFNLDHGMSLMVKQEGFSEFYSFCAPKEQPQVLNFYLNNLDYLRDFATYFKKKATKLIKKLESHKIVLPHREKYSAASMDNVILHKDSYEPIYLPERLNQCFNLIRQGKTTRDIADQLQISPRTVEDYTATLHKRLGCKSSKELMAAYSLSATF